jgi:hypothetical protein
LCGSEVYFSLKKIERKNIALSHIISCQTFKIIYKKTGIVENAWFYRGFSIFFSSHIQAF